MHASIARETPARGTGTMPGPGSFRRQGPTQSRTTGSGHAAKEASRASAGLVGMESLKLQKHDWHQDGEPRVLQARRANMGSTTPLPLPGWEPLPGRSNARLSSTGPTSSRCTPGGPPSPATRADTATQRAGTARRSSAAPVHMRTTPTQTHRRTSGTGASMPGPDIGNDRRRRRLEPRGLGLARTAVGKPREQRAMAVENHSVLRQLPAGNRPEGT